MLIDLAKRFPKGAPVPEVLAFIGTSLRREAENSRLATFAAGLGGANGVAGMVEDLYPLTDEDVEQLLVRLTWQCEQFVALEAGGRAADVKKVSIYRVRMGDALRAAWYSSEAVSNLVDSDTSLAAVKFGAAVRQLKPRGRSLDIMKFADLVLSCQPSATGRDMRPLGGPNNMVIIPSGFLEPAALGWFSRFASTTAWLLRTKIPR